MVAGDRYDTRGSTDRQGIEVGRHRPGRAGEG
jgi:hypothetical protein